MKTILDILKQGGNMDVAQLAELVETFPNAKVGVKWGSSPRNVGTAKDIQDAIKVHEKNETDYAREVFFPCGEFDKLCQVFGVTRKDCGFGE